MPDLVAPVVSAGAIRGRSQPVLAGEGVVLRPWRADDRDAVVAAYADPQIQQWHARSMSGAEAAAWIAAWSRTWHDESGVSWAVVSGEMVVGRVGMREMRLSEGWAEVGYWTSPGARGRGVAGAAIGALCRWAFDDVGFHRLELNHAVANSASCRVAVKAGFALEGTRRQQLLHPDGWHDMHLHARLASDQQAGPPSAKQPDPPRRARRGPSATSPS